MRRKDLLAIVIAIVVITFLVVFGIYYIINNGELFASASEVVEEKAEYHSNGWETDIVEEIKNGVPIPVGFSYEEGKKSEGLIVKDEATGIKYMWIPYNEDAKIQVDFSLGLKESTEEEKTNLEKYKGFYIAIQTEEEKYNEYIKENAESDSRYIELKRLGYEEYKKAYEEQLGEKFDLNALTNTNIEELKIRNSSRTDSVETHLMTIEELSLLKSFEEKIGKDIMIKDYKTLTVLGSNNQAQRVQEELILGNWDNRVIEQVIDGVPIPKGFSHVGGSVETGFKIKNGEKLQFVWIPVMDLIKEEDMNRDLGEVIKEYFIEEQVRAEGDKELEEEVYKKYNDEKQYNGEEISSDIDVYDELVESIKKYGGFYISEAELGYDANGTTINTYRDMHNNYVTNGDYYRNVKEENYKEEVEELQRSFKLTYKTAIETCSELYSTSESVVSHLTYGLEYDATVLYLLKHGKQYNGERITREDLFYDSTEIGKYTGSNEEIYISNEKSGLNKIYGLGGNLAEITRERKDGTGEIVVRGGSWNHSGKQEFLAVKEEKTVQEIAEDKEEIGIRACIYIKTEYEDVTEKLNHAKQSAKARLEAAINNMTAIDKETGDNVFNRNMKAVTQIKEYIENKIDNENSIAALQEHVTKGKLLIREIPYWIRQIKNYPTYDDKVTYGETKEECNKVKDEAIKEIESLEWDKENWVFKKNGQTITLKSIAKEAEDKIGEIREDYRVNQIDYCITNYRNEAWGNVSQTYLNSIKEKTKNSELSDTEDFDKLKYNAEGSLINKWRNIINSAMSFDGKYNKDKEKYNEWKDIKEKCLEEVLTKTSLEDVNKLIDEASKKIDEKIKKAVELKDKAKAKNDFEYTVNNIKVIDKATENNIYDKNAKVVEGIKTYIFALIDEQEKTDNLTEIVANGEQIVRDLAYWMRQVINYPTYDDKYTYGDTKEECDNIKKETINEIKNLEFDKTTYAYKKDGNQVTLEKIAEEFNEKIEKVRKEYREAQIKLCITDYKNDVDKQYVKDIKKSAEQELSATQDFAKLKYGVEGSLIDKWRTIIKLAITFDEEYPETKEYYDEWKDIKESALNKIATKTKVEDVVDVIEKAKDDIEEKIDAKIAEENARRNENFGNQGASGNVTSGNTTNGNTTSGNTSGGNTSGGNTSGGNTSGGGSDNNQKTTSKYAAGSISEKLNQMLREGKITKWGYVDENTGKYIAGANTSDPNKKVAKKSDDGNLGFTKERKCFIHIGDGVFVSRQPYGKGKSDKAFSAARALGGRLPYSNEVKQLKSSSKYGIKFSNNLKEWVQNDTKVAVYNINKGSTIQDDGSKYSYRIAFDIKETASTSIPTSTPTSAPTSAPTSTPSFIMIPTSTPRSTPSFIILPN